MSARHMGYIVTLENAAHEDDSQRTIDAIRQIRGVIDVAPVVGDSISYMAREQARYELQTAIYNALSEKVK